MFLCKLYSQESLNKLVWWGIAWQSGEEGTQQMSECTHQLKESKKHSHTAFSRLDFLVFCVWKESNGCTAAAHLCIFYKFGQRIPEAHKHHQKQLWNKLYPSQSTQPLSKSTGLFFYSIRLNIFNALGMSSVSSGWTHRCLEDWVFFLFWILETQSIFFLLFWILETQSISM